MEHILLALVYTLPAISIAWLGLVAGNRAWRRRGGATLGTRRLLLVGAIAWGFLAALTSVLGEARMGPWLAHSASIVLLIGLVMLAGYWPARRAPASRAADPTSGLR